MQAIPRFFRHGATGILVLSLIAGSGKLAAQAALGSESPKDTAPEELSQAELIESYQNLRDQLRMTQTAIVNNRFEAEANTRAQAAAIAEKIEAMNATLAAERKARQAETDRFEFERARYQNDVQKSNRSVIWVAAGFGGLGLLAMIVAALFQWRSIQRMADIVDQRIALPGPGDFDFSSGSSTPPLLRPLANSQRRLKSTIDRMEQRIDELEHSTIQSSSTNPATPPSNQNRESTA
jgi:hypothetical protein